MIQFWIFITGWKNAGFLLKAKDNISDLYEEPWLKTIKTVISDLF